MGCMLIENYGKIHLVVYADKFIIAVKLKFKELNCYLL